MKIYQQKKTSYTLRDMDNEFWAQVKAHAALERITIQQLITNLLEQALKNDNTEK